MMRIDQDVQLEQGLAMSDEGCVVAIGNFDGVHRGHQALLSEVCVQRERLGLGAQAAVALTFEPHPASYFRPHDSPRRLVSPAHKAALLGEYGVAHVISLRFDQALSELSPERFVERVLARLVRARHVVVGQDFRFGQGRAGDAQALMRLCGEHQIGVSVVEALRHDQAPISSTRVRQRLEAGDLEEARALLGRPFGVRGHVVHGDARGRTMGYPTANVHAELELFLPDGIYATRLRVADQKARPACSYLGARPTFGPGPRTFETFVLDVGPDEPFDLYDAPVLVEFVSRLREDRAYPDAQALMAQMALDVAAARAALGLG